MDDYGLPIEQLTGQDGVPERQPGELHAQFLHQLGEADAPPRQRNTGLPDVSGLRDELGM